MHYGGGGLLNDTPVICGGYYTGKVYNYESACYYHNKITNAWKLLGNMHNARSEFGFAQLNGGFWVTGGHAPSLTTSTEIIHLNGTISLDKPLPTVQAGHCMVTLNQNDVLIIGGYPPANFKKTMFYKKNSRSYTNGPRMNHNRYSHACCVFNSQLHKGQPVVLAAGGAFGPTVELLDYTQENAQWTVSKHF